MVSDQDFIATWKESGGSPTAVAKTLGLHYRAVLKRRNSLEGRRGVHLPTGDQKNRGRGDDNIAPNDYTQRVTIDGFSGRMIVFNDAHWWPGISKNLAFRALIEVIKDMKPKLIVANGDVFDGARVSRFPRNGWENQPRMVDELEEVRERMGEIRAAYRGARFIRSIGNHDIRFDRYLAMNASEMEGIAGARLSDHLPEWQECMSIFINGHTMVKHRFGNGQHAAYMATLKAGTSTFSGHTHRLLTTPWGDYNGRRYGSECGTLAEVAGPQMAYAEDGPTSACSGFMTAMFDKDGTLFYPVPCTVTNGRAVLGTDIVLSDRKQMKAAA